MLKIDEITGLLSPIRYLPSPNFNARPCDVDIDLLVIHNISLPPGEFGGPYIDAFFTNTLDFSVHPYFTEIEHLKVSAHCMIDRRGKITQYVAFTDRAWHAGQSSFLGRENCNNYSIGIELEGADDIPYTDMQYQVLAGVVYVIQKKFPKITMDRIVGHSTIAPGRKTDPGPSFNWELLGQLIQRQHTENQHTEE